MGIAAQRAVDAAANAVNGVQPALAPMAIENVLDRARRLQPLMITARKMMVKRERPIESTISVVHLLPLSPHVNLFRATNNGWKSIICRNFGLELNFVLAFDNFR